MTMPVGAPVAPPGAGTAAPAAATTPGGVGGAAATTPGAEGFGALVAAALAAVPGAAGPLEAPATVAGGVTAAAEPPSEQADPVSTGDEESTDELPGEQAAQLLGVVVPMALLSTAPRELAVTSEPAAGPSAAEPQGSAVAALGSAAATPDAPAPTPPAASADLTGDQSQESRPAPGHVGAHAAAEPAVAVPQTSTDAGTAPVPTPLAPVEGPRAASVATGAGAPAATGPVARQTFPEVTRLMSRGDGTHRVTLELRPEGLGEVRVVLTLRDGKVDVRMTTSAEARHALASDLPELHRLLAASGATETTVSVRDGQQLVSSSWDGNRSTTGSSYDLMGQAGGGTGQPQHQESPQQARTSADHIATDGVRDRAKASGPNDPATGTRTAGLDVTV